MATLTFDPHRPPPTSVQADDRTRRIVVFVAATGFVLQGLDRVIPKIPMVLLWIAAGALVAIATSRIERFIARHRRSLQ